MNAVDSPATQAFPLVGIISGERAPRRCWKVGGVKGTSRPIPRCLIDQALDRRSAANECRRSALTVAFIFPCYVSLGKHNFWTFEEQTTDWLLSRTELIFQDLAEYMWHKVVPRVQSESLILERSVGHCFIAGWCWGIEFPRKMPPTIVHCDSYYDNKVVSLRRIHSD
jgi:hypothetical protein